jgi:hypothetical protein
MDATLTATCPHCHAPLGSSDRSCAACGMETGAAAPANAARTPLILPGNPALSADVQPPSSASTRVITGALAAVAAVFTVFWLRSSPPADAAAGAETVSALTVSDSVDSVAVAQQQARSDATPTTVPADTARLLEPIPVAATDLPPAAGPEVVPPSPVTTPVTTSAPAPRPRVNANVRKPAVLASASRATPAAERTRRPPAPVQAARVASRAPAPRSDAGRPVMAIEAERLESRTESARSMSRPASAERVVPVAPATVEPPTNSVTTTAQRERESELDASEVSAAVDRTVAQMRSGGAPSFEVRDFLSSGDSHRVSLVGAPATVGTALGAVRVSFTVRLTKYDAGGRPVTRVAPVTLDVEKRANTVRTSAVSIGALARP